MKFKSLILILAMAGGVAYAAATDPHVLARQHLMDANGAALKTLGGMAKGDIAFDATAAEAAKQSLIINAAGIEAAWKVNATDPESNSKPEIWDNMADFVAKGNALGTAAAALDTTSLDGVKAGLDGIGGACGACHKAYKTS